MKLDFGKTKNIIFIAIIVIIMISTVTITAILSQNKDLTANGDIKSEELNKVRIVYSIETENNFKTAYKELLNKMFNSNIVTNADWFGAAILLNALRNAEISSDKVESISAYLTKLEPKEFPLEDFIYGMINPVYETDDDGNIIYDQDGNAIVMTDEEGNPLYELDKDANVTLLFLSYVNPVDAISDIVMNTALTANDIGSFLYEHQLLISGGERLELIKELGKENFIILFADSFEIYAEITMFLQKDVISLSEARMAREILYEQGSRIKVILDTFGSENLELYLGIGEDIFDENDIKDMTEEDKYIISQLNLASKALKGMTGYILNSASEFLTSLKIETFEALIAYLNEDDEEAYTFALLGAAREIYDAHNKSLTKYGLSEDDVIKSFSALAAHFILIEAIDANLDTEKQINDEYEEMVKLFALLSELAVSEEYLNLNTIDDIKALSQTDKGLLNQKLSSFIDAFKRLEAGLIRAEAMMIYGILFSTIKSY